jgi:hypothetical protein
MIFAACDAVELSNSMLTPLQEPGRRHLLFVTAKQLDLLNRAGEWLQIVNRPSKTFAQLYSIYVFAQGPEGHMKQMPVLFVAMSGRNQADYLLGVQSNT